MTDPEWEGWRSCHWSLLVIAGIAVGGLAGLAVCLLAALL